MYRTFAESTTLSIESIDRQKNEKTCLKIDSECFQWINCVRGVIDHASRFQQNKVLQ